MIRVSDKVRHPLLVADSLCCREVPLREILPLSLPEFRLYFVTEDPLVSIPLVSSLTLTPHFLPLPPRYTYRPRCREVRLPCRIRF